MTSSLLFVRTYKQASFWTEFREVSNEELLRKSVQEIQISINLVKISDIFYELLSKLYCYRRY
jgi:hypothetical protein